MNPKTLVIIRDHRDEQGRLLRHAAEMPPSFLSPVETEHWLERGWLQETDRRSLYRLFPHFSGTSSKLFDSVSFDDPELGCYTLPQ